MIGHLIRSTFALALGIAPLQAHAAAAHVHGQGELSIAVDPGRIELFLTAPIRDLIEPAEEDTGLEKKFARDDLFTFRGVSCALDSSRVESATTLAAEWLEEPEHEHEEDVPHEDDGHADGYLVWTYVCSQDPKSVEVGLFGHTRLERIRVQAIGPSGAVTETLTPNDLELQLP